MNNEAQPDSLSAAHGFLWVRRAVCVMRVPEESVSMVSVGLRGSQCVPGCVYKHESPDHKRRLKAFGKDTHSVSVFFFI